MIYCQSPEEPIGAADVDPVILADLDLLLGLRHYSAINHFAIARGKQHYRYHLLFACVCLVMPAFLLSNVVVFRATTVTALLPALRFNLATIAATWALMPWFFAEHTGVRSMPVLVGLTGMLAVVFIVNLLQPYTIQYREIHGVARMLMPWGEEIFFPLGTSGVWLYVALFTVLIPGFAYSFYATAVRFRRERRRISLLMMLALGLFFAGNVEGVLVRFGVIQFPPLAPLSLAAMVVVMGQALNQEIRQSARQLEQILDHVPALVYMKDPVGRYIMVNQHFESLYGVSNTALAGRTDSDVFPEEQAEAFRANDRQVLATGRPIEREEIASTSGERRTFMSIKFPLFGADGAPYAVCGISMDITERKRAEKAIIKNESKYRTLFKSANDSIFIMQGERFIDCNEKTLAMFGCNREAIIGNTPVAFSPARQPDGQDSASKAAVKIQAAARGDPQFFEWTHTRRDGQPFDAEVSLTAFTLEGTVLLLAVVRNITERKKVEKRLHVSEEMGRLCGSLRG
jgi:PAS domain S-box-containing protein